MQYEFSITPHHANHDQKYLTFEYDAGGWNNVRMGVECVVVFAPCDGKDVRGPTSSEPVLARARRTRTRRSASWASTTSSSRTVSAPRRWRLRGRSVDRVVASMRTGRRLDAADAAASLARSP